MLRIPVTDRKTLFLTLALILILAILPVLAGSTSRAAAGDPVINEFVVNHAGTDTNEYVEIFGAPNTYYSTLTLIELEGDAATTGPGVGVVDEVLPLGLTSGIGFWTTGFLNNALENGTLTLLLVEGFSGTLGQDLDTDNNGVLDVTPWTRIVDGVAVSDGGAGDRTYDATVLAPGFGGSAFTPGGASRIPNGVDTDTVADWVLNDFDGAGLPGFTGMLVAGEAYNTPGSVNRTFGTARPPLINEFVASHTGTDNYEFVEIVGDPNTGYSAYAIVQIEGDPDIGGGAGVIDSVHPLGTTDALGLWHTGYLTNMLENGTLSLLLVEGFVGSVGQDLDLDNDGFLNFMPWAQVVDSVAVADGGATDRTYAETVLIPGFDGVSFAPGGASRIPNAVDTNSPADWLRNDFDLAGIPGFTGTPLFGEAYNTPGRVNEAVPEPPSFVCGDPATPIHDVQGSGAASPLAGSPDPVVVEGVVVGDFQGSAALRGFFLQEEAGDADANPATSEGIFVFDSTFGVNVTVGDVVRVEGKVTEYYGLTQLGSITNLLVCGTDTVAPTTVTLPIADLALWEQYEGMLITVPGPLTVSGNYTLGRYGEVDLSVGGRLYTPTNIVMPGAAAVALQNLNNRSRIQIDDGRTAQNPLPLPPYFGADNTLRVGDTTPAVTGVLSYSFDAWEIHPTQPVIFTRANERPVTPIPVGGDVQVAAFNVLNYFNTIDTGAWICGPSGNMECRGADSAFEFTRQRDKIISAITALDADVIGLMEIENDGYGPESALADLVNGLNAATAPGTYAYIDPGRPYLGTDAIAVALIYKPAVVTPYGSAAILDSTVDPRFIDTRNRPALAQTFEEVATGARFTVVVNHFKSKGSACDDLGDPDTGDGQGNCNIVRTNAAAALVDWLAGDPTGSQDPDFLIIGDLNAYAMEDPVRLIEEAGYTDLIEAFVGPFGYSYNFQAQSGYLDHALAIANLARQVTGAGHWHINADEPVALDYNNYNQPVLYSPDPYHSSDHDPVLVGLMLDFEVPFDVKPGGAVSPVNPKAKGTLPVALLSTPTFDATQVDPATVRVAGAPVALRGNGYMVQIRDVNHDGRDDLFMHIEMSRVSLPDGATEMPIEAMYGDRRVYGADAIRLVPASQAAACAMDAATLAVFGPRGGNEVFLWGKTYAQVLAAPGGHPWLELARAYIGAQAHILGGSPVPDDVSASMTLAYNLLSSTDPDRGMGRANRVLYAQLTAILDGYSAGLCLP